MPAQKNIQTKVTAETHERLTVEALRKGVTMQKLLRDVIEEHFKKENEEALD